MTSDLHRDDRDPGCAAVSDRAAGYVLGALEAGEMAATRRHLATCPEAHAEFAELGGVVPYLAELVDAEEPPPALRDRIVATVTADARASERDEQAAERLITAIGTPGRGDTVRAQRAISIEPAPPRTAGPPVGVVDAERSASARAAAASRVEPPVADLRPRASTAMTGRSVLAWGAAAAAVLVVAVLGAWNVSLRSEIDRQAGFVAWQARVLEAGAMPGHRLAVLHDDPAAGAAGAAGVAAVTGDGSVMLAVQSLRPTSGREVYEAWVVVNGGGASPIGSFTVDASGTGRLETIGAPTGERLVIALSLEPSPGATTPTLPLVAQGTATPVLD